MESKAQRRRVLIVTYHYLPRRMAATYRVKAWAKYLPKYGWEPIILTRHWNPRGGNPWDESIESLVEERDSDMDCWIYRTGYQQARKAAWDWRARLSRDRYNKFLRYALRKTLSYALKNILLYPDEFVGWRHEAFSAGRSIIGKHEIDAVIATGPPWTDFLIARDLSQEFGLPWVADYRDPWTQPTSLGVPPRFAVYYLISRFIERSTMKTARALIHINEPLAGGLSSLLSRKVRVIPNGYDPEQFDTYLGRVSEKPPFTISFVGTLHANTNPYVFFEGLRLFVSRRKLLPDDCRVSFTGDGFWRVRDEYRYFDDIKSFVSLNRAVPQDQAVERMCSAHVLLLFPLDMEGCTPAKTFEYLASGRPVLVSPGGKHRSAIKDILMRTGAGLVIDSAEEIARWLGARYEEFQRTGKVSWEVDSECVTLYSRREQTRQVAEILDGLSGATGIEQVRGAQSS